MNDRSRMAAMISSSPLPQFGQVCMSDDRVNALLEHIDDQVCGLWFHRIILVHMLHVCLYSQLAPRMVRRRLTGDP